MITNSITNSITDSVTNINNSSITSSIQLALLTVLPTRNERRLPLRVCRAIPHAAVQHGDQKSERGRVWGRWGRWGGGGGGGGGGSGGGGALVFALLFDPT